MKPLILITASLLCVASLAGCHSRNNSNSVDTDTGNIDTENMDTGNMDTGNMDTGNMDTGNMDTGNMDTGNTDTDNMDTENMNDNQLKMLSAQKRDSEPGALGDAALLRKNINTLFSRVDPVEVESDDNVLDLVNRSGSPN